MIKILELFGGIGACTKAFERLGIEFEVADYVEIDKYAVASYNAIHNTNFSPQDISNWNKDIDVDFIMHGSPCQDYSLNGKNKGGDEGSGTRSSLMYETVRIVEKLKPKYIVWENVRNVLSNRHKHNFYKYLGKMESLGYTNYYQLLNAKDYGIPQNRTRIFVVSIRNDLGLFFNFPLPKKLDITLKDMLEDNVDEKYTLSDKAVKYITDEKRMQNHWTNIDPDIAITLTAKGQNNWTGSFIQVKVANKKGFQKAYEGDSVNLSYPHSTTRRDRVGTQMAQTLMCKDTMAVVSEGLILRKLTPKEYFRLMGFDDEDFEKAKQVNSDTQLYKQAGNSIVVNVLEAILTNLLINPSHVGIRQLDIFDYL